MNKEDEMGGLDERRRVGKTDYMSRGEKGGKIG